MALSGLAAGHSFRGGPLVLGCLIIAAFAYEGAQGFGEERRSGMMELLLTTPLKPWALLRGRLRLLFQNTLPLVGAVMLAGLPDWVGQWVIEESPWYLLTRYAPHNPAFLTAVVCLPAAVMAGVVAMYLALRSEGVIWPIVGGTLAGSLLLELVQILSGFDHAFFGERHSIWRSWGMTLAVALSGCSLFAWLFCRRLARRQFTLA
jgi:hypothetical protein